MSFLTSDVVVLCWETPTKSERNAHKIAAFLGADATFVSLADAALSNGTAVLKSGSRRPCLIVEAKTLAKVVEGRTGARGLQSLIDLAEHVFIYGFQPTDSQAALLEKLSSGGLLGVQPSTDTGVKLHIGRGHREWCHQFSGLSLDVADTRRTGTFIESTGQRPQAVLIRAGDKPYFVRTEYGGSQIFLVCGELADLDEPVKHDGRLLSWFPTLVPLMMFLRGALGSRVWYNDQPRACFTIDDPLLKDSYGFLEYRQLAESMREHRFSTSIAFIPWNYRRSSKEVAGLFSSTDSRASLCVHGCDHTAAEFAATRVESLHGKAQLALKRMQEHRRLSGVPFDDVMVFPQGLFSVEAMMALKASGYLAAVNSDVCPSTKPETALRDLLDVAVTRFGDFPVFGRRYPNDLAEFAFDLFLGKPALAVAHHGYFRHGYTALEMFVDGLNSLDERLEWTNLATICERSCLARTAPSDEVHVQFYTNRFRLENTGSRIRTYLLLKRQIQHGSLPSVTLNGREWERECDGGYLKIRLSLDPGQTADIKVLSNEVDSSAAPWRGTVIHDLRVRIRRFLCEFRDNQVDTNRVLRAIVSTARNVRREARFANSVAIKRRETSHSGALSAPGLKTLARIAAPTDSRGENMQNRLPSYVLVTPARNEANYIEKTIESVVAQTVRPLKWVIVSDGSTDGTDEIVRKFVVQHDWIDLVSLRDRAERNFAGKVAAFNVGQARVAELKYDVIGNLDADVSFDEEYFSFLLQKLAEDPTLGLVGTPYRDPLNDPYDYRFVSIEQVTGPCQLFRRECFEAIGGYMPVKGGAIDRIADISARMNGWKTRTYTETVYLHHRATGTSQQGVLKSKFKDGAKDYSVGTSPIWELFRATYQMTKTPLILGGLMTGAGYVWSLVRRVERPVSREMVEFCRREQMQRLSALITGKTARIRA